MKTLSMFRSGVAGLVALSAVAAAGQKERPVEFVYRETAFTIHKIFCGDYTIHKFTGPSSPPLHSVTVLAAFLFPTSCGDLVILRRGSQLRKPPW